MKFRKGILAAFLTTIFLTGCGGGVDSVESPDNQTPPINDKSIVQVSGAVQKGPFVIGTTVTVNLLSSNAENTESTIVTNTTDDLGRFSFTFSEAELLELSATGYYRNEITGGLSQGTLTLRSIYGVSEKEEQSAYVNILTHLTSQRIKNLLGTGLSFEDAKNQAENEFLVTFDKVVPNSTESGFNTLSIYDDELSSGSAYLLTVSSILYKYAIDQSIVNSTNPDAELTLVINILEADFGGNGIINSTVILESFRETIPTINPTDVSNNIEEWIDGVSGFEKIDINEYLDTDLDGVFNIFDSDDDNDGVEDEVDTTPYLPSFIIANQSFSVEEDETIDINIETNNPSDMEIVLEITYPPSNGDVIGIYPTLNYAPNTNYTGNDYFSYRLKQGEMVSAVATVDFSVTEVNDAPVITGSPITEFVAYNEYSFIPAISDIENDSLVLNIENLPNWASFNEVTGEIYGTPTNDNVGLYEHILLSVSDGITEINLASFNISIETSPWIPQLSMPQVNFSHASAEADGVIYLFGGYVGGEGPSNEVSAFYPDTNSWEVKNSMPTAANSLSAHYVEGKIYVIGGYNSGALGTLQIYDPITDMWDTGTPMNTARSSFASSVVGGKIYVIGGNDLNFSKINDVEEYDPATGVWINKSSAPVSQVEASASSLEGKIYYMGGYSPSDTKVYIYDPELDFWSTGSPMNHERFGFSTEVVDGVLYVFGGSDTDNIVEAFDPATGDWLVKTNMKTPRFRFSSSVYDGKVFVFGGSTSYEDLNSVEMYNPALD